MQFFLSFILSFVLAGGHPEPEGQQVIHNMYTRYHGHWYRNYTFLQTTEMFKHDTLANKSTWYEAVSYPDKFRIDFGDLSKGNAVIFRNDSVYEFREGKLKHQGIDANDLTFLLGGMYFQSYEQVLTSLKNLHYDLGKFYETQWKGRPVFVVGAQSASDTVNQLWIDKENLYLVRMIKFEDHHREDGHFEKQVRVGGGWSETYVEFYMDEKLIQKEYYYDGQARDSLDAGIFDPDQFGKIHWRK